MKLIKVQVKNFRSIEDSNDFDVGDLTCLVGKNEAGKTAILQALYGLNPFGNFGYCSRIKGWWIFRLSLS